MSADIDIISLLAAVLPILLQNDHIPNHNSILTGHMRYLEIIESDSPAKFFDATRMDKITFVRLRVYLVEHTGLIGSEDICPGQKLMIFIEVLTGNSLRDIATHWNHSSSTVSLTIHEVCTCFMKLKEKLFIKPNLYDAISSKIAGNFRFSPYFDDCIRALDGSHIPAFIGVDQQGVFRNRKGFLSQNVLAVVSFDLIFSFVMAGWEGSAGDGKVLVDAISSGLLRTFIGKFYLGDAGYALSRNCLTPYRGVRYHLKEWARGAVRPRTKEELFNLRHSSLRNVIERVFGILKKRFPILTSMNGFEFPFQIELVMCCFMIHNFIKLNAEYEDAFDLDYVDEYIADPAQRQPEANNNTRETRELNAWRDGIAQAMWDQYQTHGMQHEA